MRNTHFAVAVGHIDRLVRQDDGQDLMEYGLLVSLIATLLVGSLSLIGDQVDQMWMAIATGIP